jgi:hypothetical protein
MNTYAFWLHCLHPVVYHVLWYVAVNTTVKINQSGCSYWFCLMVNFFLICLVGVGIKVHSTLRPLNGLMCQPRVIMIMEKSVE